MQNLHDELLNELEVIESLIRFTKTACEEKEFNSRYYELADWKRLNLSSERNHYINVLSIALEKINGLKTLSYSKTPTIAADK